jgi:hypothetical protein
MAAFNYIVIPSVCPGCHASTDLAFYTYLASDYNEGDEHGSWMNRHYRLGERMGWFDPSHPEFYCWMSWGEPIEGPVYEYCYAKCALCSAELYGRIEFEDVTPVRLTEFGPMCDWPRDPASPVPYPNVFQSTNPDLIPPSVAKKHPTE